MQRHHIWWMVEKVNVRVNANFVQRLAAHLAACFVYSALPTPGFASEINMQLVCILFHVIFSVAVLQRIGTFLFPLLGAKWVEKGVLLLLFVYCFSWAIKCAAPLSCEKKSRGGCSLPLHLLLLLLYNVSSYSKNWAELI